MMVSWVSRVRVRPAQQEMWPPLGVPAGRCVDSFGLRRAILWHEPACWIVAAEVQGTLPGNRLCWLGAPLISLQRSVVLPEVCLAGLARVERQEEDLCAVSIMGWVQDTRNQPSKRSC